MSENNTGVSEFQEKEPQIDIVVIRTPKTVEKPQMTTLFTQFLLKDFW